MEKMELFKMCVTIPYVNKDKTIEEAIDKFFNKLNESKERENTIEDNLMYFDAKISGLQAFLMTKKIREKENFKDIGYLIEKFEEVIAEFKKVYEKFESED